MNTSDSNRDDRERGASAVAHMLAYRSPLDGGDFIRSVTTKAVRRRRHRGWVFGGALTMASAVALAMRPTHFDPPPAMAGLLHETTRIVGSVHSGGLLAMVLVVVLCLSASKAMDSI